MADAGARSELGEVRLRRVEAADLPVMYAHQCDAESAAMAKVLPRDREAFEAHWARVLSDDRVVARAILFDGEVVGTVSRFDRDGRAWVGYWIDRAHWGRGIATRALAMLLVEVGERPLHAQAARENVGSIRVLERCGFRLVGYEMSPGDERFVACEEGLFVLE